MYRRLAGCTSTTYRVIREPPLDTGGAKCTVIERFLAAALRWRGTPGRVTLVDADAGELVTIDSVRTVRIAKMTLRQRIGLGSFDEIIGEAFSITFAAISR